MERFEPPGRGGAPKGAALASVLMSVALVTVLVFSLAGTSIFHLSFATHRAEECRARNLAESVVSKTIARILEGVDYAQASEKTVEIGGIAPSARTSALLTFDQALAARRGIPHSTFNLFNNNSAAGWNNCVVPRNSVHLVGRGESNGVTRTIEVLVHVPPFPYVIAVSGNLESRGKLLVASLGKAEDFASGSDRSLLPGHVASNSVDGNAVTIMGEAKITGDVQAAGGVELDPLGSVEVLGEVRARAPRVKIPPISISSYDPDPPDGRGRKAGTQSVRDTLENPTLEGYCKRRGDLVVTGDLTLNGALLYVDGDITVSGGVRGRGALVVTGKTTLRKGADLATDNLVALLSKGDVTLGGAESTESSSFQGVVYTEGNFSADRITLLGSFLSGDAGVPGPAPTMMSLRNVTLVSVPAKMKIKCYVPPTVTVNLIGSNTLGIPLKDDPSHTKPREQQEPLTDEQLRAQGCPPDDILAKFNITAGRRGDNIVYHVNTMTGYRGEYVGEEGLGRLARELDLYITASSKRPWQPGNDENDHGYGITDNADDIKRNLLQSVSGLDIGRREEDNRWVNFTVDPNEFLTLEDKLRVLLWREL